MNLVFFNLLTNATFSMLAGIAVVGFTIWFFRIPSGPWKIALLTFPFFKIVFDFVRGVPANSVLALGIDPFLLPPKHQLLKISGGITNWGPSLSFSFSTIALDGKEYAASLGDYLAIWMNRKFGSSFPMVLVYAVAVVAIALVLTRIYYSFRFEIGRRKDRKRACSLQQAFIGRRSADIYLSENYSGTPFTGGVLRPYICIPLDTYKQLSESEREAVILHELGHIINFDLVAMISIQILGDLFWFVPGYRWLARKIDDLREVTADHWATEHGAEASLLASALIKLREIPENSEMPTVYSAFFRHRSLLKTRIEKLIGITGEIQPRFGWRFPIVRILVGSLIFITVMLTTFGGNQTSENVQNAEWFTTMLRSMGLS